MKGFGFRSRASLIVVGQGLEDAFAALPNVFECGPLGGRTKVLTGKGQEFLGDTWIQISYPCGDDHTCCPKCQIDQDICQIFALYLPSIVIVPASCDTTWKDYARRPELLLQQAVASLNAHSMKNSVLEQTYRGQKGQCGIRIDPHFAIVYFGEEHAAASKYSEFIQLASAWIEGRRYPPLAIQILNLYEAITHPKNILLKQLKEAGIR